MKLYLPVFPDAGYLTSINLQAFCVSYKKDVSLWTNVNRSSLWQLVLPFFTLPRFLRQLHKLAKHP